MNREEEYLALRRELEAPPPALERTLERAASRRARARRALFPAGGLCTVALFFVLLVNLSTTFALACGRIPLLRELAAAVAFSPSLSEAVRHNYVQLIDQSQTQNGMTASVAYVIVDERQLHIFYTLEPQEGTDYLATTPSLYEEEGTPLAGFILTYGTPGEDGLRQITVDLLEEQIPNRLLLTLPVYRYPSDTMTQPLPAPEEDTSKAPDALFTFDLVFDASLIRKGEMLELERNFLLDGQRLTLSTVEIYPTHLRLNLRADPSNTAWLKGLVFSMEDGQGNRFDRAGGVSATGDPSSPATLSYRLESPYFLESDHLTLCIEGALWLDKGRERICVDLKSAAADDLPEGVSLESVVWEEKGPRLTFWVRQSQGQRQQLFLTDYYDEQGKQFFFSGWSSDVSEPDGAKGEAVSAMSFVLEGYGQDTVWLSPAYTRATKPASPLLLPVK